MKLFFLFIFFVSTLPLLGQGSITIEGFVFDSTKHLNKIEITLLPTNLKVKTNKDGYFVFSGLQSGNYELVVNDLNFEYLMKKIHLSETDKKVQVELVLIKNNSKSLTEVQVESKTKGEANEILKTRKTIAIVTIKNKETLDQLYNKNGADLASRMPSVMLFRSKGENNMISLRGTPTDWTSVMVDGDRLPVACEDNTTRSFEFEAFPSAFVDELVESKTVTPDLESDNIGGAMNFSFLVPSDSNSIALEIAPGLNSSSFKPTGTLNFQVNRVSKNKKFSLLTQVNYYGRSYASEALKTIYGSNLNHGVNRLELRKYEGVRTNIGGQFGFVFKMNEKSSITFNSFLGRMEDNKSMRKTSINWYEDNGQRIRLQNADGRLIRQIEGCSVHYNYKPKNTVHTAFKIASYANSFRNGSFPFKGKDPRNGFLITEFISPQITFTDFTKLDMYGNQVAENSTDFIMLKLIGEDNPYGTNNDGNKILPHFNTNLTPSDFSYNQSYTEINHTLEIDPIVFTNDWDIKINEKLSLSFGAKYRYKLGERSLSKYDWFQDYSTGNTAPLLLSSYQYSIFNNANRPFLNNPYGASYEGLNYDFLTTSTASSFITDNASLLREVPMGPQNFEYNQWIGSNYKYSEHQSSAYVMSTYASKKIAVLGGIRFEHTFLTESSDTLTNELAFDSLTNIYYNVPKTITIMKSYLGILPSLNANYYINENSAFKFAISRTMHRPNFEETKPGNAVIRYNELEYTFGNPNLKPVFSINADVMFEHYFGNKGFISIGAFYKHIKNHIYTISTTNTDPISGVTIRKYGNSPTAWVSGIEFLFNRKFDFLKNKWKNLGIRANATFSLSSMKIVGRSYQPLTKQTPILFSANLYYDNSKIKANIALNYSGRYLSELNLIYVDGKLLHTDNDFDTYTNAYVNLELAVNYQINDKCSLNFEATNLLNSLERKSIGKVWRTSYVENYGMHFECGFSFTF